MDLEVVEGVDAGELLLSKTSTCFVFLVGVLKGEHGLLGAGSIGKQAVSCACLDAETKLAYLA